MESTLNLVDLPSDVLIEILCSVPASGLAMISQVHSLLYTVANNEEVWIARAKQDYKVILKKSEGFSPRDFYQLVLHKYGKLMGLWKRTNHLYYGGLLKVFYDDQEIVIEMLEAPEDVTHEMVSRKIVSISKRKEISAAQIVNHDSLTVDSPANITITNENAFQLQFQVGEDDPGFLLEGFLLTKWMQKPYLHRELHGRKFDSMFKNREVYMCERFISESPHKQFPIQPGLFKGTYSAHGNEIINLSFIFAEGGGMKGVEGIKICGDPNVPAPEVSFVIEEDMCTFVRSEDGELIFDIDQIVEYKDDLTMDFCIPRDYEDDDPSIRGLTTCKGYWQCKCQVAYDNFSNPEMIRGYFVLFSNDMFAVMFLDLGGISVYHRAKDL